MARDNKKLPQSTFCSATYQLECESGLEFLRTSDVLLTIELRNCEVPYILLERGKNTQVMLLNLDIFCLRFVTKFLYCANVNI